MRFAFAAAFLEMRIEAVAAAQRPGGSAVVKMKPGA
jgi:hypothetical protein